MSGRLLGGTDPEEWIIDATLTGAQTVYESSAPRAAWLHVIRDADPDYPWRGVAPLQRAAVSSQLARMAEDALVTEMRQPTMALLPQPQGANIDVNTLRNGHPESRRIPDRLPYHDIGRVRRRTVESAPLI